MAASPLIVQTPRVSLIGGKELPKASGEGVRVADISNSFTQLSNTLLAEQSQNKALDDQLSGRSEAEAWVTANTGKDPLGMYKRMPYIEGSPEYRAAATDTIEANFKASLSAAANTRFAAIQVDPADDTPKKLAKMAAYADGILAGVDPSMRTAAKSYFSTEIQQRQNQMVAEDYQRNQAAMLGGIEFRIKDEMSKGVSAASAGADASPHVQAGMKAIDEKAHLGVITADEAARLKENYGQLIYAAGVQDRIARATINGDVDPSNLLDFATSLDVGGDVKLKLYEDKVPGANPLHEEARGTLTEVSSAKFREKFDQQLATSVSTDLKQLATDMLSNLKANEKPMMVAAWLQTDHSGTADQLTPGLRPTYNDIVEQQILRMGGLGSPEGRQLLVRETLSTRTVAPALTQQLLARLNGPLEEARDAVEIWNALTSGRQGYAEVGRIIRDSVSQDDQEVLDGARAAMLDIMSGGEKDKAQAWRTLMNKLSDTKANSVGYWKDQYFEASKGVLASGTSFDAAVRGMFQDHYGSTAVPPEWQREMELSFRNAMTLGTNPDPLATAQSVFDKMTLRWRKDPIYTGGLARSPEFRNPKGWVQQEVGGIGGVTDEYADQHLGANTHPNLWVNDYVVELLGDKVKTGKLFYGENGELKPEYDAALAAGADLPLGTRITLQPIPGNIDHGTQFNVMLTMPDGSPQQVEVLDDKTGRPVPLVVDPHIVLSNINATQQAKQDVNEFKLAQNRQQGAQIYDEMRALGTRLPASGNEAYKDAYIHSHFSDDEIARWVMTAPKDVQQRYETSEQSRIDAYNKYIQRREQQVPEIPAGTYTSPKLLMQDKAGGVGVTLGAIDAVEKLFPDGTGGQFMMNVALAESNAGRADGTFRPSGDRGIWQINDGADGAFLEVQRRARIPGDTIAAAAQQVKRVFGFDVATASPSDLEKPLVSAVFARLYFMKATDSIPSDPQGQAELWKAAYNTSEGAGSVDGFLKTAGSVLVSEARAASASSQVLDPGSPGMVTDMQGRPFPAQFLATQPSLQLSAQRLSAAFGQTLRITPHGGTQPDYRKQTSQHHAGLAIDVYVADMSESEKTRLIATAISMGFRGIGGYGAGDGVGTLHFDLRAGGRHNGLGLWWRHRAGVDSDWQTGPAWFTDGVRQGMAMRGQYSAA